jgi:hypothetical protein
MHIVYADILEGEANVKSVYSLMRENIERLHP